jgi:hypothetical protein
VQLRLDEPKPSVLVVARDDGEQVEGSGGSLLRIRARGDGFDPPAAIPTDGLGRGGPMFVDGPAPWLAWVGPHEQLRLVPLDATGAPVGASSAEGSLDDARPLITLGTTGRMLVATPRDKEAELRVFVCQR